jgi:PAS domain S-box-containing protein
MFQSQDGTHRELRGSHYKWKIPMVNEFQESDKRYNQLVEQASEGMFVIDTDGRFILVNSKLCEMLGHRKHELLQLNIIDTYPPEEKDAGRQRLALLRSGRSIQFERLLKRKDGTLFCGRASAARLEDGCVQAIVRDVTQYKQAEENLKESEERLRQITENIRKVFWMATPEMAETIYVSPAYEEVFGRTCESLYADPKSWLDAVHA